MTDTEREQGVGSESGVAGADSITALRELRQQLGDRRELRAMDMLRHREWRRDIDVSINKAMETAPEEPGPLNSHMLIMKAFSGLDERAPQYVQRWVSYLNDLMWLEEQL